MNNIYNDMWLCRRPKCFFILGWTELDHAWAVKTEPRVKRLNSVTYATTSLCHLDSNSAFWFSNIPVNIPPSIFVAAWEKERKEGYLNDAEGNTLKRVAFRRRLEFIRCFCSQKSLFSQWALLGKVRILKNCSEERSNLKAILWVIYCFMVFQPVEVEGWECFFFVSSFLNCLTGSSLQRMGFL